MLNHILSTIICSTFEKECGRWQSKKENPQAMLIELNVHIDFENEEGYRSKQIAIYSHQNYVQVWERTWENIRHNGQADYQENTSDWKLPIDHDSCWRETIDTWLFQKRNDISTFRASSNNWFKLIPWDYKNTK